jgi:hypothetical protein
MIFTSKCSNEQPEPPAVEFKLRLSEQTIVRLVPYLIALLISATGGGWLLSRLQFTAPVNQSDPAVMVQPSKKQDVNAAK